MSKSVKDLVAEAKAAAGEVSPREARDQAENGGLILDVREAGELSEDGRVEDALHIPRGVLESRADPQSSSANGSLTELRETERPVLVLCASGARASMAAARLQEMGYRARSIEGGLKGWREAGLPVLGDG